MATNSTDSVSPAKVILLLSCAVLHTKGTWLLSSTVLHTKATLLLSNTVLYNKECSNYLVQFYIVKNLLGKDRFWFRKTHTYYSTYQF